MEPQLTLDRVTTPDGGELLLYERAGVFTIRVNGLELMSSLAHGSEEALARAACAALAGRPRPRVLVGGLGMGYTLRAALDHLPGDAVVVVVEVFPAVVEWCRGPLAHLARRPLDDPRVVLEVGDVRAVIERSPAAYDVILLDVDNGPEALTLTSNGRLYSARGLDLMLRCLRPDGVLAVWSAGRDRTFVRRLTWTGFQVAVEETPARGALGGPRHTLFFARKKPERRRK